LGFLRHTACNVCAADRTNEKVAGIAVVVHADADSISLIDAVDKEGSHDCVSSGEREKVQSVDNQHSWTSKKRVEHVAQIFVAGTNGEKNVVRRLKRKYVLKY
jgi:hypothetical protein